MAVAKYVSLVLNIALLLSLPLNLIACGSDGIKEFNKQYAELEKDKNKLMKEVDNLATDVGTTIGLISVEPVTGIAMTYFGLSNWKREVALIKVKAEELRRRAHWLPDNPETEEIKQDTIQGCDLLINWCDGTSQMFSDIQVIPKQLLSVAKLELLGERAVGQVKLILDDWNKCEDLWTEAQVRFTASRIKMDSLLKYRSKSKR